MKSLFTKRLSLLPLLALAGMLGAGAAAAQTADLLISEYVEGSANNKAVEIYNGTADAVALGTYTLDRYANGATVPYSIALPAINLAPGATHVITHNQADAVLLSRADQVNANLNFNGNDALVLARAGIAVDSVGRVGEDPGTAWTCAGGSTLNHTMRRVSSVCGGDTDPSNAYDPCLGWVFFAVDTFSGVGSHVTDCGAVADEATSWGAIKATYR
ncbi:MAG: lamin tail domain-containing protein [bacterium]|nr:lamin tail domain-containing protein [bacterium]